ncbi:hypothetical protein [Kitasatospora sp. NPDC018619]|uniref:hypothetical protein n=1 Tax=unclassified Kitasatospora TaxID=2633591 RepID=UPI0037B761B8
MVGTGAVLASVLAMYGPGPGDELSAAAAPDSSPSAADPTAQLLPVSPAPAQPAPSPLPAPTPGTAVPVGGPGAPAPAAPSAAPGAGAGTTLDAQHAPASAHPKAGHSPHSSTPARGPSGTPAQASSGAGTGGGPGTICDQAERAGRWPTGSDQARICRGLYG